MIAVLDANVLVSLAVARLGGTLARIVAAWRDRSFSVVMSESIFQEVERAFGDPYFRRRLTSAQIEGYLHLVREAATFVPLSASVAGVATHPEDDAVLATAVSARADYLVTGDRQLLGLGQFQGIQIVDPGDS